MSKLENPRQHLSTSRTIRIHRREICFVKHIFEAYEGVALLTTLDPERGVLRLRIPPGQEVVVAAIIDDLRTCLLVEDI